MKKLLAAVSVALPLMLVIAVALQWQFIRDSFAAPPVSNFAPEPGQWVTVLEPTHATWLDCQRDECNPVGQDLAAGERLYVLGAQFGKLYVEHTSGRWWIYEEAVQ